MPAAQVKPLAERLDALRVQNPELEALAVISVEGVALAASLPDPVREQRLAAMTAAMLAWGERIADELGRGRLSQVYIKGEDGFVLLLTIDEQAVLTALVNSEAQLGFVFLDLQRAVDDLSTLL